MQKRRIRLPVFAHAVTEAWRHAGRAHAADGGLCRLGEQLKYAALALRQPRLFSRWFEEISRADFAGQTALAPRFPLKPLRVYLSSAWKAEQRIAVILSTRRFARAHPRLEEALEDPRGALLASVQLPRSGELRATLMTHERFRKEGELVLSLSSSLLGEGLAQASFSLEERARGIWLLRIGCVQGNRMGGSELTKLLAKELHGLRPKALLLFCLREIGAALDLEDVLGVGNRIQAHGRKHAIHLRWLHALSFDYDAFWLESGGREESDGWYSLGCETPRRTREETKPNKRAQYLRRYVLMDEFSRQIGKTLSDRSHFAGRPAA